MQENPSRPSRPLAAPAHWLARLKVSSLSAGILLAMTLGLVLPAIIGALMLSEFRRQQLDLERQHYLNDKMEVMARVLAEPLWNFDMDAVHTIGDTVMLDPEVTAFQVTDPQSKAFLQLNDPSRHLGQSTRLVREIVRQGETLGLVQLEIDDGLRQSSLNRDRRFFLALLGGQFLLGLLLVYLSLRRRVLHPLERLTAFSSELAQGHLDTPITLESLDEIGQLARQLDRMRSDLNASFAEKSAILDNIRVGVVFVRQRRIVLANHAADLIFGTQPGGLLGRSTQDIYLSEQQSEQVATAAYRQIAEPGGFFEAELQLRRQDGGEFWALMRGSALNPRAVQDGSVWIFEDITARRQASEQLRLSATVFENTADAVVITDAHHAIVAVNRSFSRITGYGFADVAGQTLELLRSERSDPELYPRMRRTLDHQHFWEGEIWARKKSGEPFIATLTMTAVLDEDLSINHYVGVCQDVTDKKATEREIRFLAYHDTLTGLPNRKALLDALHARLEIKGPGRHPGALLLIDLDNFKILNDTRGHDIGDQLLIEVARRLQALAAPGDMVARMGGDEFMLLLSQPGAEQAALEATRTLARKILDILALPYRLRLQIAGTETQELLHQCTASIGIALLGRQDHAADELMKQADTAMYRAKAAGRHTALFYDPAMQADVTARALLELELHQALREDQFLLHYQAQVDIEHRVLGVEALIRWQHPRRGAVSPLEFVPLAEEVGLILPIGEWVLNTACAQLAAWSRSEALAGLSMAVNVSAKQFLDVHFVRQVLNAVQLHGIDPTLLKLEITESLLLHDLRYIAEKMGALKSHGIRFSMDDFGTGYSSLSYLQRLPFDQLKIDRAFVSGVGTEGEKSPIVSAIIALGQNLGLDVIAEGVETEIQRDTLAAHGCLVYQGYLYNRPMPAAEFESWLQQVPHPMA